MSDSIVKTLTTRGGGASGSFFSSHAVIKKQQRKTEITLRLIIVFALAADISRRHDKHEGVIRPDAFRNRDKISFNIRCLRLPQRQQVCESVLCRQLPHHQPGQETCQRRGGDRENNETAKHDNALFFHQRFLFQG
ncbi:MULTISPECIES: hypothetical protein [unclassified Pantoea]|uniref:hypothetical protein n=1 Tax=unclassified Pantoea TaxID=2630326 RepID=UPI00226A6484|nr:MULTISPECIES: hypothetical protein [unclassified Pantoea]